MSIKAEIIADSLNPVGNRLTTFVLEYPRFVHAELLTHRLFSRNASSSRAIPIEKMIQSVMENPAMPEFWGKNQSGMQAAEELDNTTTTEVIRDAPVIIFPNTPDAIETKINIAATPRKAALHEWLIARSNAVEAVKKLNALGVHKQIANRILEPWLHIRIILSATEFENWFALRAHKDAQPEIQKLAYAMLELYNASQPKRLQVGEWHIPFGDQMDEAKLIAVTNSFCDVENPRWNTYLQETKQKIAIARCARISYLNFEGKDDYAADVKLCDRLFGSVPRHLSPAEHVAQALENDAWIGNFQGFKQYRKFFADECLKDTRVKKV